MNNCKEFILEVMAITAIPVSNRTLQAADKDSVVNRLTPTVPAGVFAPTVPDEEHPQRTKPNSAVYGGSITFGRATPLGPGHSEAALVPISRDTGKAKDDESDSVAGRLHTVTASCEVDERGGEIWTHQLTLERAAHHLLLTYRDGSRAFVAATEDTYQCNVERDGAKVAVSFRIQNLMGIQQLAATT